MSLVVCLKTITYANQAKFVTKSNGSFIFAPSDIYLFKFLLEYTLYPVFFSSCFVSVLSVQLHLGLCVLVVFLDAVSCGSTPGVTTDTALYM